MIDKNSTISEIISEELRERGEDPSPRINEYLDEKHDKISFFNQNGQIEIAHGNLNHGGNGTNSIPILSNFQLKYQQRFNDAINTALQYYK